MLEMVPPNRRLRKSNDLLGPCSATLFSDFLNMPFDPWGKKGGGYGLHECEP